MSRKRLWWIVPLAAVAVAAIVQIPAAGAGTHRTVFMSAVEYKGGTSVTDEAYPPAAEPGTLELAPVGGGYRLKPPDATGRWEVSSYRFEPGIVVVNRGEWITLEIAGINGARHDGALLSPSGETVKTFVITRGRLTRVKFHANQAGVWTITCHTHPPGMTGQIVVI